ncbi:predicted protein [Nematostella vectensis]|uniref:DZIP3-like HEPN domain-containing protein n=1 Tax=Nematostella vectensis TaxID=45351 RepID=A7T1S6_NEMVE|nr:predicted protein [Nematostella vectensis]|eukprot:XP_001622189.1 predicted protein [Nematostella vectensis]
MGSMGSIPNFTIRGRDMACSLPLSTDVERERYLRLAQLLVEEGTTALRKFFDNIHSPATLAAVLTTKQRQLQQLLKKGILSSTQWSKLFPASGNPESRDFDITLLSVLLRNICGIRTPNDPFWNTYPPDADISCEANLVRIRMLRNELGHSTTIRLNESQFEIYWEKISSALVALGSNKLKISDYKMRPIGTKDYIDVIRMWVASDDVLLNELQKMRREVKSTSARQELKYDTHHEELIARFDKLENLIGM